MLYLWQTSTKKQVRLLCIQTVGQVLHGGAHEAHEEIRRTLLLEMLQTDNQAQMFVDNTMRDLRDRDLSTMGAAVLIGLLNTLRNSQDLSLQNHCNLGDCIDALALPCQRTMCCSSRDTAIPAVHARHWIAMVTHQSLGLVRYVQHYS